MSAPIEVALEAAERELRMLRNTVKDYDTNFPCDGGCNTNDGPEETCSRHGRSPRDLWDLLDRARSGAHTLGEIVERHVEDTLRWAGMEDQVGSDDPDQQLAWERCAEMPGRIAALQAEVAALRADGGAA